MTGPTYTFAADFSLPRDQIRDMVGDTDVTTDPILSDEAIAFYYAQAGSELLPGAIKAAKAAAAKLAREFDKDIDGLKTSRSQRHKALLNVIAVLEDETARENASFIAPESGMVADVAGYPTEMEHTDLGRPDWDADE